MWTVDVSLSSENDTKRGVLVKRVSRVHLSTADFPDPLEAEMVAQDFARAMHNRATVFGPRDCFPMPTRISHCL